MMRVEPRQPEVFQPKNFNLKIEFSNFKLNHHDEGVTLAARSLSRPCVSTSSLSSPAVQCEI